MDEGSAIGLQQQADGMLFPNVYVTISLRVGGQDGSVAFPLGRISQASKRPDVDSFKHHVPNSHFVVAGPSAWKNVGLYMSQGRLKYCDFMPAVTNLVGFRASSEAEKAVQFACVGAQPSDPGKSPEL